MSTTETKQTSPNLPELEAQVARRWSERDVFARSLAQREDAPRWVFFEGPPTANGRAGVHHVLGRTFKDCFARHRTMTGHLVERKAGWDCHGLPVELEVERELGFHSKDEVERYGVAAFNARCRASVTRYTEDWEALTAALGFWLDQKHPYRTMDDDYVESVWWALSELWRKDLLYRSEKVVPHCPRCQTSLSSHELAQGYQNVTHDSAYVRFPLHGANASLLAWTTTPWTLPANLLLAVNPTATYVRVRHGAEELVLAEDLLDAALGAGAEVLERFSGAALVGRRYEPPFRALADQPGTYLVVGAGFVDTNSGTGVVHVAPAHGQDDFELGARHGLRPLTPVGRDGRYDERMGALAGQKATDAQPALLAELAARGLLARTHSLTHSYPHCWRCQTELVYLAKPAWYARTTAVAQRMRELNRGVSWYPEGAGTGRFDEWLKGNVDWALSRERYWGTPLPLWCCANGHVRCVGSRAELSELTGEPVHGLHREDVDSLQFDCPECGERMSRTPEVLDVWFDSGAMQFAQHHWPFEGHAQFAAQQTADYVCEMVEQTRGWFYSLLALCTMLFDRAPYRNVLCVGVVADENGQKMSKSRGNAADPWTYFRAYGADAVRWFFLSSKPPWEGYQFPTKPDSSTQAPLRDAAGRLMTLWHVASFWRTYANAAGVKRPELDGAQLSALDRFALSRLEGVSATVADAMERYDATAAARALDSYMEELSNWYLRLSRRRLWDGEHAALATLRHCLTTLARLLAPLVPHLADAVWEMADGDADSVHLCEYPTAERRFSDPELERAMALVQEVVGLGRAARAKAGRSLRQPLARVTVLLACADDRARLSGLSELVRSELNVKQCTVAESSEGVARWVVSPNWRLLGPRLKGLMKPLAGALAGTEHARLAAELQRDGQTVVEVDGQSVGLTAAELDVRLEALPGVGLEVAGELCVALQTALSDELEREGLARELTHELQQLRRALDLDVSDRVALRVSGDEELLAALQAHREQVAGELLATSLEVVERTNDAAHQLQVADRELSVELVLTGRP